MTSGIRQQFCGEGKHCYDDRKFFVWRKRFTIHDRQFRFSCFRLWFLYQSYYSNDCRCLWSGDTGDIFRKHSTSNTSTNHQIIISSWAMLSGAPISLGFYHISTSCISSLTNYHRYSATVTVQSNIRWNGWIKVNAWQTTNGWVRTFQEDGAQRETTLVRACIRWKWHAQLPTITLTKGSFKWFCMFKTSNSTSPPSIAWSYCGQ